MSVTDVLNRIWADSGDQDVFSYSEFDGGEDTIMNEKTLMEMFSHRDKKNAAAKGFTVKIPTGALGLMK